MKALSSLAGIVLGAAVLTACGGNGSPATPAETLAQLGRAATPLGPSTDSVLYVGNGSFQASGQVTVVGTKSGKVLRTITNGVNFPYGVAVDSNGNAYVANRKGQSNVTVYAPNTSVPALTITQDVVKPLQLQFDPAGDLNVLNVSDVTVYAPMSGTLLRKVGNKLTRCLAMTFDSAGDLFVLNANTKTKESYIVEYAAGSTKVLRTFGGSQFAYMEDLVMGPDGYLYVGGTEPAVLVFDPSTGSVVRTITNGVYVVIALAFDAAGNFYVANDTGASKGGTISVYAPEATTPSYQIIRNGMFAEVLLFDQRDNLYVVSPGGVFEFAPGKTTPKRTFDTGTEYPWAAAFGP